jgi:hypothetical protein
VRVRLISILVALALVRLPPLQAQDLTPRAYLITPVDTNALTLTWSYYNGGIDLNGTIPITGATGSYSVPVASYYHSFNFFGRSANIVAALPYGIGTFQGNVLGTQKSVYRSGLLDATFRISVNLIGGPALPLDKFTRWKQKNILGASLKIVAPTGQYSGTKLINWGINRWAFKPEIGYSRRLWDHWLLDAYGGAWLFTSNPAFFNTPLPSLQTEAPIGSFEGHLSYQFKNPRCWISLDGNYWFGGATTLNGIPNPDTRQTSSRLGTTFALPLTKHQSLKFAYNKGTYIRFGGDYHNVQVAWQYSWIGKP